LTGDFQLGMIASAQPLSHFGISCSFDKIGELQKAADGFAPLE
jgi:hypothetical protein